MNVGFAFDGEDYGFAPMAELEIVRITSQTQATGSRVKAQKLHLEESLKPVQAVVLEISIAGAQ